MNNEGARGDGGPSCGAVVCKAGGDRGVGYAKAVGLDVENQPWSRSYVNSGSLNGDQAGRHSSFTLLFGTGRQLAELNCNIEQADQPCWNVRWPLSY